MPKRHPERVPQRSCAVCRQVRDKRALTRVVRGPDATLRVDPSGRANGRGAYVCDDPSCRDPHSLAVGMRRSLSTDAGLETVVQELSHASA